MLLAIETSVPDASLALFDRESGEVVWSSRFSSQRAHNAVIFDPLNEALQRCGRKLDLIAIGRGPGSYGGVRVGIAVANGLSLALGAKVIGLSSLEAMDTDSETYVVIGDARRQSYFVARVENGRLTCEPELVSEADLVENLTGLRQEGIPVLTADAALADAFDGVTLTSPSATRLARLAATLDPDEIATLEREPLEPHYLRAPYITMPKG